MRIQYQQERNFIFNYLRAIDVPEDHATIISDMVTHSDFTGVYSHGLSRFSMYMGQFLQGGLNKHPDIRITSDSGSTVAYDCDNGSGLVAVNTVYDEVLKRAKESGIAIGTGCRSSNIGCASYYGWRAARDNMICIFMSNTSPLTAPYGGADKMIGTNPIVMSCPAGEKYPLVLDMSTTNVAIGKVIAYAREGKEIPLGWGNDINGVPTTDPTKVYTMVPLATYKGYGLAVFVDIFSAVLAQAFYGTMLKQFTFEVPENTGFAIMLIDPSRFMPLDQFKASVDDYANMIKNSRKATGFDEIFLPGEIEFKKFKENTENGIEISENLVKELSGLAIKAGVLKEGEDISKLF